MTRTPLTDHQPWLIVNTSDDVSDEALAEAFGCKTSTIHAARWRLKCNGWTCKVSYGVCPVCEKSFTRQGHKAGRRVYHPECSEVVLKQLETGYEEKRWERLSDEECQLRLARAHQHTRNHQEESQQSASNRGVRWQPWEDELIQQEDAPPDVELAKELGRTLYAVRGRRRDLRDQ